MVLTASCILFLAPTKCHIVAFWSSPLNSLKHYKNGVDQKHFSSENLNLDIFWYSVQKFSSENLSSIIFLLILHSISCCNSSLTLYQPPHNWMAIFSGSLSTPIASVDWVNKKRKGLTPSRLAQKLHGNIPKFGEIQNS